VDEKRIRDHFFDRGHELKKTNILLLLFFILFGCIWSISNSETTDCKGYKEVHGKKFYLKGFIDIYGTWIIYRSEDVGKHSPHSVALAKKSVGQIVEIGKDTIQCSDDSLVASKGLHQNVQYCWKSRNYSFRQGVQEDAYDLETLNHYGLKDALQMRTLNVIASFEKGKKLAFEITKKEELAVYVDGYFVFLKKKK
jgi:hypothetical protein